METSEIHKKLNEFGDLVTKGNKGLNPDNHDQVHASGATFKIKNLGEVSIRGLKMLAL